MVAEPGGGGLRPALSAAALLASLDNLDAVADLQVTEIMNRPSPHLSFDDLRDVAQKASQALAAGAAGVVVVQGTDSIEVTAFALDLLAGSAAPIVVTGAMRGAQLPGADGPANLSAAIRVAAARRCRDLGALVVMNDEIHAARYVVKGHSSNPAAFVSDPGPIGRLVEGEPQVLLRPPRLDAAVLAPDSAATARPTRVFHIAAEIDDDGALVRAALETGCEGLVVSGMGGGHVAPAMVAVLEAAAARLPVVLTTKCPGGGVLARTYGYAGAEIDLAARGLVRAGLLTPSKARAALVLLLRAGQSLPAIRGFFSAFGGG